MYASVMPNVIINNMTTITLFCIKNVQFLDFWGLKINIYFKIYQIIPIDPLKNVALSQLNKTNNQ